MRVYCPDCAARRTVPDDWTGRRLRCRNCDRVFRAGTRAPRRPLLDEPDEPAGSSGVQKLLIVLGGVVVLAFGLVIGGGLGAWYMLNRMPDREPDDDEVEVDDEGPPPMVQPVPFNPQPPGNPPEGPGPP